MNSHSAHTARVAIFWLLSLSLALSLTMASGAWADQQDLDAEIERYSKVFSGSSFGAKKQALHELAWAGISDPRGDDPKEAQQLAG